jgi:acyl carrier protein
MERQEIKENIIKIITENLEEFKEGEIDESTVINTDAALDSMRFIYVMTKIESFFDIEIPQRKWEKLQTLKDLIDVVESSLSKKK